MPEHASYNMRGTQGWPALTISHTILRRFYSDGALGVGGAWRPPLLYSFALTTQPHGYTTVLHSLHRLSLSLSRRGGTLKLGLIQTLRSGPHTGKWRIYDIHTDFNLKLPLWPPYCKMVDFKVRFNLNLARCPPFWEMADYKIKLNLTIAPYPPYCFIQH